MEYVFVHGLSGWGSYDKTYKRMPVYPGDHMSLQGGMTKRNDIRPFYLELLELIDELPAA